MFSLKERENPMLVDENWKEIDTDTERKDSREVCPICGLHKFKDNSVCYGCQISIRKDLIFLLENYGKENKELVIDEIEGFIEIL